MRRNADEPLNIPDGLVEVFMRKTVRLCGFAPSVINENVAVILTATF